MIIYYSDLGLENEGKLKSTNHILNMKVLSLLSDQVLIPLNHLVNANTNILLEFKSDLQQLFKPGLMYTQLPKYSSDSITLSTYFNHVMNQTHDGDELTKLNNNTSIIQGEVLYGIQEFRTYNPSMQVGIFYNKMKQFVEQDTKLSDATKKDLIYHIEGNSDIPLSKRGFDSTIQLLHQKRRINISHLPMLSEICYYTSGAISNKAIISSNSYLSDDVLELLNKQGNNQQIVSNRFYNPNLFINIMKLLGIINHENEILKLTITDILRLKSKKQYAQFINAYRELSKTCDDFSSMIAQKRKYMEKVELVKNVTFSFGLTMSETMLTSGLTLPLSPLVFTIITFLLQSYIENTSFKLIKRARYYLVDNIVDSIMYGNDMFLCFCNKLKTTIERYS